MRAVEPWVVEPLSTFVTEAQVRVALLMTRSGQVVAQYGFTRSLDVMTAASLGAGIVASTHELAKEMGSGTFGAVVHHGSQLGVFLAPFDLPEAQWIGLAMFGPDTSLGMVQLFFGKLIEDLTRVAPRGQPTRQVLAEAFEDDLNSSLRALFGR